MYVFSPLRIFKFFITIIVALKSSCIVITEVCDYPEILNVCTAHQLWYIKGKYFIRFWLFDRLVYLSLAVMQFYVCGIKNIHCLYCERQKFFLCLPKLLRSKRTPREAQTFYQLSCFSIFVRFSFSKYACSKVYIFFFTSFLYTILCIQQAIVLKKTVHLHGD